MFTGITGWITGNLATWSERKRTGLIWRPIIYLASLPVLRVWNLNPQIWIYTGTGSGHRSSMRYRPVSTRFKTRCLNFFQIFPANVFKTHTTFYSLVCCYWDAVSFARFWEAIEVILLRKSQISPENFKVDIWKQRSHLKAKIWKQILYLKAKNPCFGGKRRANRPLLRTDRG